MTTSSSPNAARVINYDADGYDYRHFWDGRDYEQWAETRVIRRLLQPLSTIDWMVDLGGGFGRNVPLYLRYASHVVLIDYSWTNLKNAEATLLPNGPNERVFLIRGNIYHLPFRDSAFDVGATIRVLHHLAATNEALAEMSRVIARNWLLDVPIKHHLLARAKAMAQGQSRQLNDWSPNSIGTPEEPFYNFHLDAIRTRLEEAGWSPRLVASVANFRRWERAVPRPARSLVRPVIYGAERVAQRAGRGWWGPAQFLWLSRGDRPAPSPGPTPAQSVPGINLWLAPPWNLLAPRLRCPRCAGDLVWAANAAACSTCQGTYARTGAIWDFVVE